jgi:lipid II:glycine glycyltransferase (peptidoglycan interpeptide bridge formation enzyme)
MFLWQLENWGKMLLASKQAEKIFNVDNIQVEKRCIGMWQYGLFILAIELEKIWNKETFKKLEELTKNNNCLFFQVETLKYNDANDCIFSELFKVDLGFYKKFITEYTAVINLEKDEDEILSLMKPKGRYNIKLAQKKEVEVKSVEKTLDNIKLYYNLMLETTLRDNFSGNSIDYYINFLNKIENSELLLAYKDEKVIAWGIFTFDKEVSIYYYWASTSNKNYRNLMAPYLLQWEAIKIAKNNKSKLFDFLGVSSPGSEEDSLSGVTNFKKKLTLDIRKVSEWYIFIRKPFTYKFFNILRKIKKILK